MHLLEVSPLSDASHHELALVPLAPPLLYLPVTVLFPPRSHIGTLAQGATMLPMRLISVSVPESRSTEPLIQL